MLTVCSALKISSIPPYSNAAIVFLPFSLSKMKKHLPEDLKIWDFCLFHWKKAAKGSKYPPSQTLFLSCANSSTLHCYTFDVYFYEVEHPICSFQSVWEINAVLLICNFSFSSKKLLVSFFVSPSALVSCLVGFPQSSFILLSSRVSHFHSLSTFIFKPSFRSSWIPWTDEPFSWHFVHSWTQLLLTGECIFCTDSASLELTVWCLLEVLHKKSPNPSIFLLSMAAQILFWKRLGESQDYEIFFPGASRLYKLCF